MICADEVAATVHRNDSAADRGVTTIHGDDPRAEGAHGNSPRFDLGVGGTHEHGQRPEGPHADQAVLAPLLLPASLPLSAEVSANEHHRQGDDYGNRDDHDGNSDEGVG